jgi:hypothetical protein
MSFGGYNGWERRRRDSALILGAAILSRFTPVGGRNPGRNIGLRSIIDVSRRLDAWRRINVCRRIDVVGADRKAALGVTKPFLPSGFGLAIVCAAAPPAQFPVMMLATAERTVQILTVGVARMGEEPNPAVSAVHRAAGQLGTSLQNGVQRTLILTNKRTSTLLLVPILAKTKNLFDAYDKKARLSAILWTLFCMSSSYPLDATAPREGEDFFWNSPQNLDQARRANAPPPNAR